MVFLISSSSSWFFYSIVIFNHDDKKDDQNTDSWLILKFNQHHWGNLNFSYQKAIFFCSPIQVYNVGVEFPDIVCVRKEKLLIDRSLWG